jgi:hypothetical protein
LDEDAKEQCLCVFFKYLKSNRTKLGGKVALTGSQIILGKVIFMLKMKHFAVTKMSPLMKRQKRLIKPNKLALMIGWKFNHLTNRMIRHIV